MVCIPTINILIYDHSFTFVFHFNKFIWKNVKVACRARVTYLRVKSNLRVNFFTIFLNYLCFSMFLILFEIRLSYLYRGLKLIFCVKKDAQIGGFAVAKKGLSLSKFFFLLKRKNPFQLICVGKIFKSVCRIFFFFKLGLYILNF